ncbi:MAG: glycosyltransferase family 2 protein [Planctomycetes bacterium]|nr:glycosyltransferase family 2 protein [Planctomycetota bacterium]
MTEPPAGAAPPAPVASPPAPAPAAPWLEVAAWAPLALAPGVEPISGISLIVTAYNEEGTLERVVHGCRRVARALARESEVLVVNDGSKDGTRRIANRLEQECPDVRVIHHPFNVGFGGAQKSGFLHARHEFVSLVPGDGQFDARELLRYVPYLADADIVVGYRVRRQDNRMRRFNTLLLRTVMRLLFGVRLHDINWVKIFRRRILERFEIESRGIGVDAEVVVKAARAGCRFAELEVSYLPRTAGASTGDKPLNVLITGIELLSLWWQQVVRGRE